jgi:L-amino acid N-acyltransferase YncA
MKAGGIEVRKVVTADAVAIAAIYLWHVENGTATFETVAPSEADWVEKIEGVGAKNWPFLVVEDGSDVVGYAYAMQFRDRPAYCFTCENSIYIAENKRLRGFGRVLLAALLTDAEAAGFRQMIAVVGGGEPSSIALHRALGFVETGRMRDVGFKFGRWLDTVYMQRTLAM